MNDAAAVTEQPRRSPAYPALDLRTAIERARALYANERKHPAPIPAAVKHWGYKGPNGRTNGIIGALKQYGLIVDQGSGPNRKIQVTDAAVRILEHPIESERLAAVQKAALLPRIHAEMWAKYGPDMPSDDTWAWNLREDRNFTETGAAEFVREYKATVAFAQLAGADVEDREALDGLQEDDLDDGSVYADDRPGTRSVIMQRALDDKRVHEAAVRQARADFGLPEPMTATPIPLPGGGAIVLQALLPISEANWRYFTAVLEAMKPGLVEQPAAQREGSVDDGSVD
jgi:hypothetical protein